MIDVNSVMYLLDEIDWNKKWIHTKDEVIDFIKGLKKDYNILEAEFEHKERSYDSWDDQMSEKDDEIRDLEQENVKLYIKIDKLNGQKNS